ncbi:tetratricopeptide (TPR) repeat protein [Caldalkalibacillus uzonensis]|uniref:Tetratricopeptide (TPR) repeat protein n=1 Tax=Caldalkalibacillus uzonensis TaxID=353224 RepID=A0ABU0CXS5_9BACI|nr:tetratricopeptide repeat protein [Caldalkalibacillus uzonensis]MDQ0340944.1 tetratricopeptide (TPR) repeat protein [Caldalkalibacillus uzonensis]
MLRPQPIGVFPGTAGFLLLPSVPEGNNLLSLLLRGDLPDIWPDEWRFFAAAIEGQSEQVVLSLLPQGPEGIFNRFILDPQAHIYALAKERMTGDLSLLLDAVAWRYGLRDTPPPHDDTTGEVRAFLLATQAYGAFQKKDWSTGLELLLEAAKSVRDVSPVFSSRLYAEWAATKQMLDGHVQDTVEGYRHALDLLETSSFQEARAELWFQLGTAYQTGAEGRKELLLEAVKCYHEALKVYRKETHPESYAMVHMNLALAYLSMPAIDRGSHLRTAVAIQSLREALHIFQKETHPELWASATVNLANALQHVKTSHPEENLWEAVALYEDVLAVRRPEDDLLGYARVLANQGNALAHLGAFSRAVPRLEEASRIFRSQGEQDAAEAVEEILAEIARKQKVTKE